MTTLASQQSARKNTHYISAESFELLQDIMYEQTMAPETYLFWEGDKVDKLFYIKSGKVKLTKTTDDGKQFILHMFQAGDLLGDLATFSELTYSYSAEVQTNSVIGVIQQKDLDILLWQHGSLAVEFMKWLGLTQRITQSKFRDLLFYGKTGALCSTLIRMSNSYGKSHKEGTIIYKKITNSELGEYIGASRESVNRMLSDFKSKDVLSQERGYIVIKDLEYLKEICHCEDCPLEVCRM